MVEHDPGARAPFSEKNKQAPNDADWARFLGQYASDAKHPERYILGKAHPDRARQFKPFAALRGYEELIAEVMAQADEPHDFSALDEGC